MRNFFLALLLCFSLLGILNFALATSVFDITYPVAELENCADQSACKTYCDDLSHKDACSSFAEKYGFINKEEAQKNKNLSIVGPGGCQSQDECHAYCEDSVNIDECSAFAEKYGLQGKEVSQRAKLIKTQGGPGKCQSEKECRAYCENPSNQKECFEFAQKNGLIDKQEAKMIKKVLEEGGPGNCRSEKECRQYCENPDNFQECIEFAKNQGVISEDDFQRIQKMPPVGPGGCRGEDCKNYCENSEHQEECLKFAEDNNLLSKDELELAKEMIGKTGPGGCHGEQCRVYCDNSDHQEECLNFAIENNLIPKEEAERAKKFMKASNEGGPGGCKKEECRAYCETEDHQDECFEFAKSQGLIPEEELRRTEKGMSLSKKAKEIGGPGGCKEEKECREYCSDSSHVEECAAFAVEQGGFSLEEAKTMLKEFTGQHPDSRFKGTEEFKHSEEDRFKRFEDFRQLEDKFRSGSMKMPMEFNGSGNNLMNFGDFSGGPGGCKTAEECIKFCSDLANRNECAKFNPSQGAMSPGKIFKEGAFQNRENSINNMPMGSFSPIPFDRMNQLPSDVVCSQEYAPVCGTDKNTYPNNCYAKAKGVNIAHQGECKQEGTFNTQTQYPYPQMSSFMTPDNFEQFKNMMPPYQSSYPGFQPMMSSDFMPIVSPEFSPTVSPESSSVISPSISPSPSGFNRVTNFLGNIIQGLFSIF